MMWSFDLIIGRFYGITGEFCHNATDFSIITQTLTEKYNLTFLKTDEAIFMSIGTRKAIIVGSVVSRFLELSNCTTVTNLEEFLKSGSGSGLYCFQG